MKDKLQEAEEIFENGVGEVYRGILRLASINREEALASVSSLQSMLAETSKELLRNIQKETTSTSL